MLVIQHLLFKNPFCPCSERCLECPQAPWVGAALSQHHLSLLLDLPMLILSSLQAPLSKSWCLDDSARLWDLPCPQSCSYLVWSKYTRCRSNHTLVHEHNYQLEFFHFQTSSTIPTLTLKVFNTLESFQAAFRTTVSLQMKKLNSLLDKMEDESFQGIMICLWELLQDTVNGTELLLFLWQFCTKRENTRH